MITLPGHILTKPVRWWAYHTTRDQWSRRVLVAGNRLNELPQRYLTGHELAVVYVHKFHHDRWVMCHRGGPLRRFPTKEAAMMFATMLGERLLDPNQ